MTISSNVTAVGTVATLIYEAGANPVRLDVHNNDNSDAIYLGNSTVTTSTGRQLLKQEALSFILNPVESIYAVSTKSGHNLSWVAQSN